jgi:Tfp pilus assembly protein PilF
MMTFGYLLCYKVFGFSPAGFHLANLALHTAIVFLLFFLTRRMFQDRTLAFGAAALFALHPIHTESVAWIAAVTDLELTLFYVLTFQLFLLLARQEGVRLVTTYLAMIGSFALALLSKEQAVTLPFLATVYEHFYRESRSETSWGRKFSRYFPLWVLAVAYIPLRLFSLGGFVVISHYWGLTRQEVILSALALLGQYLRKLLWPVELCAFYVFDKSGSVRDPRVLAGVVCGILLCAGFLWLWKHARLVSFGLIWMVVTLAPVLNPKWLGLNVFAERYLYLPSVGFCWVLAWGLQRLWGGVSNRRAAWRRAFATALILVALLWSFRIVTRNQDWQDDMTLYTRTLVVSPDANLIRVNLATTYKNQGFLKQAEDEYREALERDPECVDCLNYLGGLYVEQSRDREATELLTKAVRLDPHDVLAHLNLGAAYQHTGRMDYAAQQFRRAAALAPQDAHVHTMLGLFYQQQGDQHGAEAAFQRALLINPYNNQVRIALAKLYETDHQLAEAIHEFETVLQNEPGNFEAVAALRRLKTPRVTKP